ncbi:hypothetical protein [Candidatus Palauibacter sp.]|uniref:hypothetical protein n=1 Tax=Candidatus Palauibacter sp. TaxID=3101350 RepID=UPI003B024EEE
MGTDLIADLALAATLIGVCVIFCGLSRNQRKELRSEIRGADERWATAATPSAPNWWRRAWPRQTGSPAPKGT